MNHHTLFTYMARKSNAFIYANGFLLLTVSVTPFPIAVLGEHLIGESYQAAITFYCGYNLLSNLSWIVLFMSLNKPVALYTEEGKKVMDKKFGQSKYLGATIYFATFILSFWFPYTALILNVFELRTKLAPALPIVVVEPPEVFTPVTPAVGV